MKFKTGNTELTEKYRPRDFSELIGNEQVVSAVRRIVERAKKGDIKPPHMLFSGPPGVGKTTLAYIVAKELGYGIAEFNASDERGIDTIRNKIKHYAFSTVPSVIFLDEADALTPDAQNALRRIMEDPRETALFILSCNYPWKIIEPIRSRCAVFVFRPVPAELIFKRLVEIISREGISFVVQNESDKKALVEGLKGIANVSHGDVRQAIKILEKVIDENMTITPESVKRYAGKEDVKHIVELALGGDFEHARRLFIETYTEKSIETIMQETFDYILQIPNHELKTRLLIKLSEISHRIAIGGHDLLHYLAFLAYCYVLGGVTHAK